MRVLEGEKGPLYWMNIQLNDFDEALKTSVRSFGLTWNRTGLGVMRHTKFPKAFFVVFCAYLWLVSTFRPQAK